MARPQPGINPITVPFARVEVFEVLDIPMKGMSVGQCAAMIPGLGHLLLKEYPGESLSVTLGFGNMFWLLVWHAQQPRGLEEFEEVEAGNIEFPATEGDLFIYYKASRLDLIEKISNEANHHFKGMVELLDEVTSENNPIDNVRVDPPDIFIGPDEPEFSNGCFVLAQKFESRREDPAPIKPLAGMDTHTGCMIHLLESMENSGKECMTLCFHKDPDSLETLLMESAEGFPQQNGLDSWHPKTGVRFFIPSLDVLTGMRQGGIRMNRFSPTQQWKD